MCIVSARLEGRGVGVAGIVLSVGAEGTSTIAMWSRRAVRVIGGRGRGSGVGVGLGSGGVLVGVEAGGMSGRAGRG
jgi:hypothetical protein